jgi:hypothetical protein
MRRSAPATPAPPAGTFGLVDKIINHHTEPPPGSSRGEARPTSREEDHPLAIFHFYLPPSVTFSSVAQGLLAYPHIRLCSRSRERRAVLSQSWTSRASNARLFVDLRDLHVTPNAPFSRASPSRAPQPASRLEFLLIHLLCLRRRRKPRLSPRRLRMRLATRYSARFAVTRHGQARYAPPQLQVDKNSRPNLFS